MRGLTTGVRSGKEGLAMRSAPAQAAKCYTIYDLAAFPDDDKLRELVDGQIVEWDLPTRRHGFFEALLTIELGNFVRQHRLGRIGSGEGMVRIQDSERDARGYDIAFYRRDNVGSKMTGDLDAPATVHVPDLVVELISPSDRADRVLAKIHDWLRAGVRLLWYIDPETGATTVYEGDHIRSVAADETLDGGAVLPGFSIRLRDLLAEIAASEAE